MFKAKGLECGNSGMNAKSKILYILHPVVSYVGATIIISSHGVFSRTLAKGPNLGQDGLDLIGVCSRVPVPTTATFD